MLMSISAGQGDVNDLGETINVKNCTNKSGRAFIGQNMQD